MNTSIKSALGNFDVSKSTTVVAAKVWGVGLPYIHPWALTDTPLAPSHLIFLPAAVAHVGRATDPDWGDWEQTTLHFPPFPVEPKLRLSELIRLDGFKAPKPPLPIPISVSSHRASARDRGAEKAVYERAKAEWDGSAAERHAAHQRLIEEERACFEAWGEGAAKHAEGVQALHKAFAALVRAVLDGKVRAFFRQVEGGKMQQLEPSILTRSGLVTDAIRSGTYDSGGTKFYLFADRTDLERTFPLAGDGSIIADGGAVPIGHLSPFLQLAIHVALSEKVDANYRVKKDVLLDEINRAAEMFGFGDEDLGVTAREYLATFIRWPKARKGRAET